MDRSAFVLQFQQLLRAVEARPSSLEDWTELAAHIDGSNLNYEESLISMEELSDLDEKGTLPWDLYVWEHVHALFPENTNALQKVVEFYLDIRDDAERAAPFIDALLQVDPKNTHGLHYRAVLCAEDDDLATAEASLLALCEVDLEAACFLGTFGFFEDFTFLAPVAAKLLKQMESTPFGRRFEFKEELQELVN